MPSLKQVEGLRLYHYLYRKTELKSSTILEKFRFSNRAYGSGTFVLAPHPKPQTRNPDPQILNPKP